MVTPREIEPNSILFPGQFDVPGSPARSSLPSRSTRGRYPISTVLQDPSTATSLFASFPSLSSNPYVPSSISSLSTSFTSSGTLPRASTGKAVAQRRSQAPPVVISDARRVLRTEFDSYLSEVASEWERWEKERRLGRRGMADLGNRTEERRGSLKLGLGIAAIDHVDGPPMREEEELPSLEVVPKIFFDKDFNLAQPRTFDLVTEKIMITPASSPRLTRLDLDSMSSKTPRPGLGPLTLADLATDQILQEKLSHYTAVVESHLVREIGIRSGSFFSALSNLQDLHSQGEQCLGKIGELQRALCADPATETIQGGIGGVAKRGLAILRTQARRRALETIDSGMKQVEEVFNGLEAVRELVDNGEWISALEVSEQIEAIYFGSAVEESEPKASTSKINLRKVKALQTMPARLATLRVQVAKSLESEMMGVLDREMELGVEEYMTSVVQGGWKGKGKALPSELTIEIRLEGVVDDPSEGAPVGAERVRDRARQRIQPVVAALVRAEGMEGAVSVWREAVLRDVRSMVREHLPTPDLTVLDDDDAFLTQRSSVAELGVSEKSLTLARNLRALTHAAFVVIARDTYSGLLGCIEVVDIHAKVLLELAVEKREEERIRKAGHVDDAASVVLLARHSSSTLTVPSETEERPILPHKRTAVDSKLPSLPNTDNASLASDLSDVVHAAAELAIVRFSKVIAVRSELHASLSLEDFLEIFDCSWSFVVQCEVICRRMIVGLRGVMVGQAKLFLQTFHQKKITEGARLVENEQWVVAEVRGEVQHVVELILLSAVSNPAEFLLGIRKDATNGSTTVSATSTAVGKQVNIEGSEYFAVGAGLNALETLGEYLKVVMNFPLLTTDAMSKVIEYMKVFNSRTCQVVLGAGAMRSAGLKNITAKHLALASQALSIMISLIPYIRETLRRHLNPKQAVMLVEFDKLKRDYQEHQNEIHSKLVAIMSDRLQVHCKSLQAIDWETANSARAPELPNTFAETLVKEHVTLHKVLSRFLQSTTVEFIMLQVVVALNQRLQKEFDIIEIKTENARARILVDVLYMKTKLSELKGLEKGLPCAELEDLVKCKLLAIPPTPMSPVTAVMERASSESVRSTPRPYFSSRRSESTAALSTPISAPSTPERNLRPEIVVEEPVPEPTPEIVPVVVSVAVESAITLPDMETPTIVIDTIIPASAIPLPASPSIETLATSRPATPLPVEPPIVTAIPEIIAPVVEAPRRRSMAERLSEIARRGSGDLPPPLRVTSPIPVRTTTLSVQHETGEPSAAEGPIVAKVVALDEPIQLKEAVVEIEEVDVVEEPVLSTVDGTVGAEGEVAEEESSST